MCLSGPEEGVKKYSVQSCSSTSSFAHVTLSRDKKFIACLNGECSARRLNRRAVRHLQTTEDLEVCEHLDSMRAMAEIWSDVLETNTTIDDDHDESEFLLDTNDIQEDANTMLAEVGLLLWSDSSFALHKSL